MAVLNFNIGVLGHIDSGKTSLAKALSTVASTASFDKHPQSRERGITLDLGFSSFTVPVPLHVSGRGFEHVQFTLVDCPGHASLIRTIIGGAQIIDLMMLVVDATKGMQTQTAECLVIGEITCDHMIVVLNKTDLLEPAKREAAVAKMSKKMLRTLEGTRFAGATVVSVSARPGGSDDSGSPVGLDTLVQALSEKVFVPERSGEGPCVFSVDHCFPVRGQGTVLTGTILSGALAVNESLEIPFLKVTKKIKSMQMFRQPVQRAAQGDRVGVCVTQFDAKLVERCLACSPGHLPTIFAGIINVSKISYHKLPCLTGAKFHVTLGHETVMAKAMFFGSPEAATFDLSNDYCHQEALLEAGGGGGGEAQFALLEFEKAVCCPVDSLVIGSRLDWADTHSNLCRIAFHGRLLLSMTSRGYPQTTLPALKVFKYKSKHGLVDRLHDERSVIGRTLFKKETNMDAFVGMKVNLSTGEVGIIEGSFGTSGKFRVSIVDGLKPETLATLSSAARKKHKAKPEGTGAVGGASVETITILLNFKRYIFDPHKRMVQSS